jgi:hypothetical protein
MVERTLVRPPSSRLGPISPGERTACLNASPVSGKYDTPLDRESAYEVLGARTKAADGKEAQAVVAGRETRAAEREEAYRPRTAGRRSNRQTIAEAAVNSDL